MRWLFIFIFFPFVAIAQLNDSLRNVDVRSRKQDSIRNSVKAFQPGVSSTTFDSLTLSRYRLKNISELISEQSPVFIRSYGYNSLATLSFRGASSAQSQVLWDGIPITNAGSGITDLSLLPVAFMDEASIVYGSSAALTGSGNVGGALLLDNEALAFDTVHTSGTVSLLGGSFKQKQISAKIRHQERNWNFGLRFNFAKAINDFSYIRDGVVRKMMHAGLEEKGVLLDLAGRLKNRSTIRFKAWLEDTKREIPPALFEQQSVKDQRDRSLRLVGDWNASLFSGQSQLKLAFVHDQLNYDDAAISLVSEHITNSIFLKESWLKTWNRSELLLLIPLQYSWLSGKGYSDTNAAQADLALALSWKYHFRKLEAAFSLRAENVNQWNGFMPGVSAAYLALPWLKFRGSLQRTFRAPSLNELYYFPGGNRDLLPEEGWSGEGGFDLHVTKGNFEFEQKSTFFDRLINNWIIWYGGAIWTPHNIASVLSRGLETENKFSWADHKWRFSLGLQTAWILSTTEKSVDQSDKSIGKQIPYVPRENYRAHLSLAYDHFQLNYDHNYTGYRFITSDESAYVDPYQLGSLYLSWGKDMDRINIMFSASVENLWDQVYTVVAYRPMPLRHGSLSVSVNWR